MWKLINSQVHTALNHEPLPYHWLLSTIIAIVYPNHNSYSCKSTLWRDLRLCQLHVVTVVVSSCTFLILSMCTGVFLHQLLHNYVLYAQMLLVMVPCTTDVFCHSWYERWSSRVSQVPRCLYYVSVLTLCFCTFAHSCYIEGSNTALFLDNIHSATLLVYHALEQFSIIQNSTTSSNGHLRHIWHCIIW